MTGRFRFWKRPLWGTLETYRKGILGGRLTLGPGDATHRWAALVWNAALNGYPVPDVPVELHVRRIKDDLVERIMNMKRFYVLNGERTAVRTAAENLLRGFFREAGIPAAVVNDVGELPEEDGRAVVAYADEYLLIDKSCPQEIVKMLLADGFTDASPRLREYLSVQERNERLWTEEVTKRLKGVEKEECNWDQKCCLLAKSEEVRDLLLKVEIASVFGSVASIITDAIPCDAVFCLKGVPIAVFCENGKIPQEVSVFFPKAALLAYEIYGEGEHKWMSVNTLEHYEKLKGQKS